MLDCISGGRLVAGMPLGTPMDANMVYGITPIEQRERYYEAHDLIMKAWTSRKMFAWNGKYQKLADGEPLAPPGADTASAGVDAGQRERQHVGLRRQARPLLLLPQLLRQQHGPAGHGRVLGVRRSAAGSSRIRIAPASCSSSRSAETDAQAEKDYAEHIKYFYAKCLHIPSNYLGRARTPGLPQPRARNPFGHGDALGGDADTS